MRCRRFLDMARAAAAEAVDDVSVRRVLVRLLLFFRRLLSDVFVIDGGNSVGVMIGDVLCGTQPMLPVLDVGMGNGAGPGGVLVGDVRRTSSALFNTLCARACNAAAPNDGLERLRGCDWDLERDRSRDGNFDLSTEGCRRAGGDLGDLGDETTVGRPFLNLTLAPAAQACTRAS